MPNATGLRLVPALALLLLFASCALPPRGPVGGDIADLRELPQDLTAYVSQAPDPLAAPEVHERLVGHYHERFFAPWAQNATTITADEAFWGIAVYGKRQGYGENMLPRPEDWFDGLANTCRVDEFPSMARRGIALRNTALRVMPTAKPFFYDFAKAGEGYPFDYFQNSALWAGTPVFVSHATADGSWLLCEAPFAWGWVPAHDVGFLPEDDSDFVQQYAPPLAAVIQDRTPVHDANGRYLFTAHVGAVFPLVREHGEELAILAPKAHSSEGVIAAQATLSTASARSVPMALRAENVARVGNAMLGQLYGWGGMYENRDCSAMVRDLFAPFGIWLPRNSRAQAGQGGRVLDLSPFDPAAKHQRILEEAVPFATLVGMPGHIMLYLGSHKDEAVVYHNLWGLRTKDLMSRPGRYILGRAVVTSLTPGEKVDNLDPERTLLNRVSSLTFVTERDKAE